MPKKTVAAMEADLAALLVARDEQEKKLLKKLLICPKESNREKKNALQLIAKPERANWF